MLPVKSNYLTLLPEEALALVEQFILSDPNNASSQNIQLVLVSSRSPLYTVTYTQASLPFCAFISLPRASKDLGGVYDYDFVTEYFIHVHVEAVLSLFVLTVVIAKDQ